MPKDYPIGSGALSEKVNELYPCLFTTGRKVYHYHTGTMTRECKPLELGSDIMGATIEVSEDIARERKLEEGCYALVENKRGKIAAKVNINRDLRHGTIFTTFHYAEADGNVLANAQDKDPLSGMNPLKMTIAKIKRISEEEFLEVRNQTDIQMHPSELYRAVRRQ
nr:molybdopterin dinucleotide binding domain-containing protein [Malaciobacter marinus]